MTDPRLEKLATVLVNYSLDVQPGNKMLIRTTPLGEELALAAYAAALRTGAHIEMQCDFPRAAELFFKHATQDQLEFVAPSVQLIFETYDRYLQIGAEENTRGLSAIDPAKQAQRARATHSLMQTMMERSARREMAWCYTVVPTYASAQEADMSLGDYEEFIFKADKLHELDPVAAWKAFGGQMQNLADWLKGRSQVVLKGKDIDLSLSIQDRSFVVADGRYNFPDGEIFTGPVEDSVNGWVRFQYPAIFGGREATDIQLWFENGRVVREQAAKGQDLLSGQLDTDPGARYLGELGIGTNYDITRFTKNMLFDEKLGGTIHLAVGASYPETGGKNESGLHWDMLCDMSESEITVDGELFYRNGKPLLWE